MSAGEWVSNYATKIFALGYLAMIAAERGETSEARRRVAAGRALAERQALGEHFVSVNAYYAAGELALAEGELAPARAEIEHGLSIARRGGLRLQTVYGLRALARVAVEAGARPRPRSYMLGRSASWRPARTPASCAARSGPDRRGTPATRHRPATAPTSCPSAS